MAIVTFESKDLLTASQIEKDYGINRMRLWRLVQKGIVHPLVIGGRKYYFKARIEEIKA